MSIKPTKEPLLFSAGTLLAYKIAKRYYKDIHYVWCTTKFDSPLQPVTSNPLSICKRFLEQITTGDRHSVEINSNKAGILIGAKEKLKDGTITAGEYKEINTLVSCSDYEAFSPVLYIINSKRIAAQCIDVVSKDKASDRSIEYKIEKLSYKDFEVIKFKDLLNGIIDIADRKAGD